MTLKQWIQSQPERGIVELLQTIHTPSAPTGTTAPNLIDAYDKWAKVKIKALKLVASEAGIVKSDLRSPATVDGKLATWIDGLTTANKIVALRRLPVFYQALFDFLEDAIEIDEDAQVDVGSQPIAGLSLAQVNGWGNVTGDDVERAIRED